MMLEDMGNCSKPGEKKLGGQGNFDKRKFRENIDIRNGAQN